MADARHRLELRCPTGDPNSTTIYLDGEQLMFVRRVEFVLDAKTGEASAQLTVPAAMLDIDVDAAAFVTAHTDEPAAALTDTPMEARLAVNDDLPLAEAAWAAVQARHAESQ